MTLNVYKFDIDKHLIPLTILYSTCASKEISSANLQRVSTAKQDQISQSKKRPDELNSTLCS